MRRKLLFLFLFPFLFLSLPSLGQQHDQITEDLLDPSAITKGDTNTVNQLNQQAEADEFTNADNSIRRARLAYRLADSLHFPDGMAFADLLLSGAYTTLGNYRLALYYSFKCRDRARDLGNQRLYIRSLSHLVECYSNLGEYEKALEYARINVPIVQMYHPTRMSFPYADLARCFGNFHQYDSAIYYGKKAFSLYDPVRMKADSVNKLVALDPRGYILHDLASAYMDKGDYDSALKYFRMAIPAAILSNIGVDLMDSYNGISELFLKTDHVDSASWYCKKMLGEKMAKYYPLGTLAAMERLSRIYQKQSKTDSALKYLTAAAAIRDSIFNREKTVAAENLSFSEQEKETEIAAARLKYQNQAKLISLAGGLVAALIIASILYRSNRTRKLAYNQLRHQQEEIIRQKEKTEQALTYLKSAQSQLIQSEKMASLGELTAGIAHEIQNPLNFVNNFSEVNSELIAEMKKEIEMGNIPEVKGIADTLEANMDKITNHGRRADAIVKSMLQHSLTSTGQKELTDINSLADEYLRLSYQGFRARDKTFNATIKQEYDGTIGKIDIIPQDIGRVLLNLYNNGFYAISERKKLQPEGYEPTVSVSTKKIDGKIEIKVKDNGLGISEKLKEKIFQPFFTTKPAGQGTGLGLSLSYDIIKAHGGEIRVETKEARPDDPVGRGEGAEFVIQLPS